MERSFESAILEREAPGGVRVPLEFYIRVRAQQEMKYSASSQNELALKMLQAGIVNPRQAAELMVFEGREQVLKELNEQQDQQQKQGGNNEEQLD